MLSRANENKKRAGAKNVDFIEARITDVPLEDGSVDCIVSNCVINLVPEAEKDLVFAEAARLLRPGGRLAVSDILAKRRMPTHIKSDMAFYVGCIAGASIVEQYEEYLGQAGFEGVLGPNHRRRTS